MQFLKTLIQPRKKEVGQTVTPILSQNSDERQDKISPQIRAMINSPDQEEQTKDFTPLSSLSSYKRRDAKPTTLKLFRQFISPQKIQKQKTRSITPFVQPQFLIRTLFEEHTLTIKMNHVKYFACTRKGLRNFQTLQNQDVIMVQRIATIFKFFVVFDGHGQYGKLIAESCAGYLKKCLKAYQQQFKREISEKQIVSIVKNCIKKTQHYLYNFKFNEIQYSGTTALIVIVTPRSIISFNIGNSRLIIAMGQQSSSKIYDFQVTHDQDLNRLDERKRVKEMGAIICPLKDQLGQNFGPDRLWIKNQKRPGTFITRALGLACGTKAGIICDPEVSILTYDKRMKFLVIASDGLWGVQENDQVIQYLQRYYLQRQFGMGVSSLIQQAVTRWKKKSELMDDITIIGINLSKQI